MSSSIKIGARAEILNTTVYFWIDQFVIETINFVWNWENNLIHLKNNCIFDSVNHLERKKMFSEFWNKLTRKKNKDINRSIVQRFHFYIAISTFMQKNRILSIPNSFKMITKERFHFWTKYIYSMSKQKWSTSDKNNLKNNKLCE